MLTSSDAGSCSRRRRARPLYRIARISATVNKLMRQATTAALNKIWRQFLTLTALVQYCSAVNPCAPLLRDLLRVPSQQLRRRNDGEGFIHVPFHKYVEYHGCASSSELEIMMRRGESEILRKKRYRRDFSHAQYFRARKNYKLLLRAAGGGGNSS